MKVIVGTKENRATLLNQKGLRSGRPERENHSRFASSNLRRGINNTALST
jgi:hypothetical protein